MGRITKADFEAVEAERDEAVARANQAESERDKLDALNEDQYETILDLREQVEAWKAENDQRSIDLDVIAEEARAIISEQKERIDFLVIALTSIFAYKGDDVSVPRSLALAAAKEFVPRLAETARQELVSEAVEEAREEALEEVDAALAELATHFGR